MLICPSCGRECPPDFAFCPACGAKLGPEPVPPPDAVSRFEAATTVPTEERKVVTTLFCDLVSFTAHSEVSDHELIDALLQQYNALARKLVEEHGGAVEKFIGDAVLAVFGFPQAHEDDAERAVRCGLQLVAEVGTLTWPDGDGVQVRIGVNSGETYLHTSVDPSSGQTLLTGDAVNTASRLQTAAPSNGVVGGELTQELTKHAVAWSELEPLRVKGKKEPVRAWLAQTAGESRSRTGLRTTGKTDTPFLGRDHELRTLLAAFDDAASSHQARFVLLVGEPGIGKSRLVLEFARKLDERPEFITWRQGRCLPFGKGIAFWALGEIVKAHAGILDSDDVPSAEAKLEAVLPAGEDGPWLRQRLRPLLGLEAAQASRDENHAAWTRFLELVASPRPTVIVLEDLHWAGEAMLDFVEHLLTSDLKVPLLVITTTRPELLRQHEGPLTAEYGGPLRRVTLPTLSQEEAGTLLAHLLAAKLDPDFGKRIVELAGGNPLYAEQYTRLLLDRGLVVRARDGARLAADATLPLPATVQALLASRLDTLPPDHKALLCDAAVIGETFWRGGVVALSGRDAGEIDQVMTALVARELVRPVVAPSIEGDAEYLFWHALVRDVAYEQLPRKMRARKHEAAARWIEGQAGERVDDFAEILVHHHETALSLARAIRDDDLASSLAAPTIDSLARAGTRALRLDVAAAEQHLVRALELAASDPARRLKLLPLYAKALLLRNRYREAVAIYEEAIAGFRAAGDIRGEAAALCWLGNSRAYLGEPVGNVMREAAIKLDGDEPSPEKAEVLGHYALSLLLLEADPHLTIEAADDAIVTSERLGLPEAAMAISCRGLARLALGDVGGLEDYKRAVAASQAQGLGSDQATIEYNYLSPIYFLMGARAMHDALIPGLEFAESHGLEAFVFAFRAGLVVSLYAIGEWDDALAEIRDLVPEFEKAEDVWDLLVLRAMEAVIHSARGTPHATESCLDWIATKGRECEIMWTRTFALLSASVARMCLGQRGIALDLLAECIDAPRAAISQVEDMATAVRTALAGGDVGLAERVLATLESGLPDQKPPLHQNVLATIDALLAEARGEHEAAAAGFAGAAARWHEFGVPYEEAQALLGQGRCLVALGRAPEAGPVLEAARAIFARLGARPALAETEALLAGA